MRWQEHSLSQPAVLSFPDSTRVTAFYYTKPTLSGKVECLRLDCGNGRTLDLIDAVDSGATTPYPRVFSISSDRVTDKLVLIGGPVAYRAKSSGATEEFIRLYREWGLAEYWATQFIDTEFGLVFIYENGVLLITEQLQLQWHQKKYLNDFYEDIRNGKIYFLRDHEERWSLSLSDGQLVGKTIPGTEGTG